MNSKDVLHELNKHANSTKAEILSRFFKTGKGQYGEGDRFLGIVVPTQRLIAKKFIDLEYGEVSKLIKNKYHEVRLTGFFILVYKIKKADEKVRKEVFDFYLENLDRVNNWDLVDVTARDIVGGYLFEYQKNREILYGLARSENFWHRRVAIISTFYFLTKNDFTDTLKISEMFLADKQDLIHKATGWMLREVGKRDKNLLTDFLNKHSARMPRTMLRYAIERLLPSERKKFLNKIVPKQTIQLCHEIK